MKGSLLSVFRKHTKLLNSIVFLTCWAQIHAHANFNYLNKRENLDLIKTKNLKETSPIKSRNFDFGNKATGSNDSNQPDVAPKAQNKVIKALDKPKKYIEPIKNVRYYISDIKEGIIGTDADHPIDQVFDNIFNIDIKENINPDYQYTLEYELYGFGSYNDISKVINDKLAKGGYSASANKTWTHQSEPISNSSLSKGINNVIFTTPYVSKQSYRIKNLRIGISNKKKNSVASEQSHYKALSISKFVSNIGESDNISLSSAEINIEKSGLKSSEIFSITALRDIDMPVLSPEMVNVTSENAGYRFLPHGEHFSIPAKVSLGYDKSKIPAGYTEQDIKTYYFDKSEKKWIALDKDKLNTENHVIVSKTTHFTDMVNGILKVPESPETGSYAPNSIKDIKAANPSEGIVSIAPPSPNSMGSVTTSFPIKLPAGRAGMQPSLGVSYSSEGGNGWMGLGWDMSIPAITIDTRWGVPTYGDFDGDTVDDGIETEIYLLGGEQLTFEISPGIFAMPNRNEGFNKPRQADRQFYPRIEGSYNKIIRKGHSSDGYVWIVTSKDGTKSYFGGDETGVKDNAVLRDINGNIGH